MGNSKSKGYQVIPQDIKMGTHQECPGRTGIKEYKGYGNSVDEAIESLTKTCNCFGVPVPINVPNTDQWYCGTFDVVFWAKTKKRYNTVWFKKRNGRYLAYTYYEPM